MRSIGKVKIKKLKAIVAKVYDNDMSCGEDDVIAEVPTEWFDLWEGAWSEIHRIVGDELSNLRDGFTESL